MDCRLICLCVLAFAYGVSARSMGDDSSDDWDDEPDGVWEREDGGYFYFRPWSARRPNQGRNKMPNIVLMLSDDHGWDDLGWADRNVISPNLDKMAYEGVRLSNYYVQPVCTPTRVATMTGRYPYKQQLGHFVIFAMQPLCIPLDIKLLPEYLKDEGYNTMAVGKWHLGFCKEECLPTRRGFDKFYGFYQGEQDYYEHTSGPGAIEAYDWRNQDEIDYSVDGKYNTYIMTDYVVDYIENYDSNSPFFMYLAWPNPHTPLDAPDKYTDMYPGLPDGPRREMLGLVTSLDEGVGNVTVALKKKGVYENTLTIFFSDNGGSRDNAAIPWRGSKASLFQGGVRAQGFVHGSMVKKIGYVHDGLMHAIDWLPTIMGIIKAREFEFDNSDLDGYDQSDMIIYGRPSKRNAIVLAMDSRPMSAAGQAGVIVGDWKLLWGGYGMTDGYYYSQNQTLFYTNSTWRALVNLDEYVTPEGLTTYDFSTENSASMTAMLTLTRFDENDIDSGEAWLFNLKDDPLEQTNLAGNDEYADKLRELKIYVLWKLRENIETGPDSYDTVDQSANPSNYNNTWSTGWCNDIAILNEPLELLKEAENAANPFPYDIPQYD